MRARAALGSAVAASALALAVAAPGAGSSAAGAAPATAASAAGAAPATAASAAGAAPPAGAAPAARAAPPAGAAPAARAAPPAPPPAVAPPPPGPTKPPPPPPTAPKQKPVHLQVSVNGDLLIHSPIYNRAKALGGGKRYEFRPMLRYVKPIVQGADLALCHVETPMGPGPPHGYPQFNTPRGLAPAIKATGWDACSTASNHSLDGGQRAIASTGRTLTAAGVKHTGSFTSSAARGRTLLLTVKGVKVAFMSYTEMTNGIALPFAWSVNLASASQILADARMARRRGAQVVIVNVHWGNEYQVTPSAFQKRLASALTASKAITAVVGQHAHVVQPIRSVHGKLVVFGEGNLLSNQSSPAASQDGLIALLDIRVDGTKSSVKGIRYVPTWVRRSDYTVLPIGVALRRNLADGATLRASYRRTVAAAGRRPDVQPEPRVLP